ncbi:hypothetical protein SNEBB_002116 [Seison nebaliae]|nr:hypothetical protein SNEBB_002116 [Seison nebaliae]
MAELQCTTAAVFLTIFFTLSVVLLIEGILLFLLIFMKKMKVQFSWKGRFLKQTKPSLHLSPNHENVTISSVPNDENGFYDNRAYQTDTTKTRMTNLDDDDSKDESEIQPNLQQDNVIEEIIHLDSRTTLSNKILYHELDINKVSDSTLEQMDGLIDKFLIGNKIRFLSVNSSNGNLKEKDILVAMGIDISDVLKKTNCSDNLFHFLHEFNKLNKYPITLKVFRFSECITQDLFEKQESMMRKSQSQVALKQTIDNKVKDDILSCTNIKLTNNLDESMICSDVEENVKPSLITIKNGSEVYQEKNQGKDEDKVNIAEDVDNGIFVETLPETRKNMSPAVEGTLIVKRISDSSTEKNFEMIESNSPVSDISLSISIDKVEESSLNEVRLTGNSKVDEETNEKLKEIPHDLTNTKRSLEEESEINRLLEKQEQKLIIKDQIVDKKKETDPSITTDITNEIERKLEVIEKVYENKLNSRECTLTKNDDKMKHSEDVVKPNTEQAVEEIDNNSYNSNLTDLSLSSDNEMSLNIKNLSTTVERQLKKQKEESSSQSSDSYCKLEEKNHLDDKRLINMFNDDVKVNDTISSKREEVAKIAKEKRREQVRRLTTEISRLSLTEESENLRKPLEISKPFGSISSLESSDSSIGNLN